LYGHHFDPIPVTLELRDATRTLSTISRSSLVTINLDGTEHATLVRDKQRDFIRGTILHVDFQVVSLTEKIRATITIELTGLSPAVKDFNGVVVNGLDKVEVECLPQDLPERFVVDISKLAKIGEGLYVRDLEAPENVSIMQDADEMIVIVTATKEEAVEEVEVVAGVEEPEIIEKGKKEEEEEE
jgi:large subunit ribosomal protein L25